MIFLDNSPNASKTDVNGEISKAMADMLRHARHAPLTTPAFAR
jgi:hypothetical protein